MCLGWNIIRLHAHGRRARVRCTSFVPHKQGVTAAAPKAHTLTNVDWKIYIYIYSNMSEPCKRAPKDRRAWFRPTIAHGEWKHIQLETKVRSQRKFQDQLLLDTRNVSSMCHQSHPAECFWLCLVRINCPKSFHFHSQCTSVSRLNFLNYLMLINVSRLLLTIQFRVAELSEHFILQNAYILL